MSRGSPITDEEYEALAGFRYALRLFLRFSEEAARAARLEPQQHQALLAVRGFGGAGTMSVGGLAECLQIRHHSAVGLVDRLVALGLVRRETSAQDRRRVLLKLTPSGRERLGRVAGAHRSELRRIGPRLESFLRMLRGGGDRKMHPGAGAGTLGFPPARRGRARRPHPVSRRRGFLAE
jgi:DNA-binding MarR family transcriptional regulator